MEAQIRAFVKFLDVQQERSPETIVLMAPTFGQFQAFVHGRSGTGMVSDSFPQSIAPTMIRDFLAWLDQIGLKKKVPWPGNWPALRSFFRLPLRRSAVVRPIRPGECGRRNSRSICRAC